MSKLKYLRDNAIFARNDKFAPISEVIFVHQILFLLLLILSLISDYDQAAAE